MMTVMRKLTATPVVGRVKTVKKARTIPGKTLMVTIWIMERATQGLTAFHL